jgi:hypothetical protein
MGLVVLNEDAAALEVRATETEQLVAERKPIGQAFKVEIAIASPFGERAVLPTISSHLVARAK